MALERAKREGMTNDTVQRAIDKASGAGARARRTRRSFTRVTVPAASRSWPSWRLTDNRNRTAAEIRYAFSRHGGSLGETGTVGWQFDTVGQIVIPADLANPDDVALQAIDAGAANVVTEDDEIIVTTEPAELNAVAETLKAAGVNAEDASVTRVPQNMVHIERERVGHRAAAPRRA